MSAGPSRALIAAATIASAALVIVYLALGGGAYQPTEVADPCAPRDWRAPGGLDEAAQQFGLSALDGAACRLRVSREELAAALATEESRAEFAAAYGISEAELESAVRAGLVRAIDDAEAAGALDPILAGGLRAVASRLPIDEAIALIEDAEALFEEGGAALGELGGLLDAAGELVP